MYIIRAYWLKFEVGGQWRKHKSKGAFPDLVRRPNPSADTRLYEREGLLKALAYRREQRLYTEEDLDGLEFILDLAHDLGVNIASIAIILDARAHRRDEPPDAEFRRVCALQMLARFQQAAPARPRRWSPSAKLSACRLAPQVRRAQPLRASRSRPHVSAGAPRRLSCGPQGPHPPTR